MFVEFQYNTFAHAILIYAEYNGSLILKEPLNRSKHHTENLSRAMLSMFMCFIVMIFQIKQNKLIIDTKPTLSGPLGTLYGW